MFHNALARYGLISPATKWHLNLPFWFTGDCLTGRTIWAGFAGPFFCTSLVYTLKQHGRGNTATRTILWSFRLIFNIVILRYSYMGLIRREIHKAGINKLADQLRAIAHPARLALLERIAQSNDCICTDLSKEMRLAQATISQHLKVLKEIGIIKGTIEGNSVCYCIDEKFLRSFKSDFMELFEDLESACCSDKC